MPTESCVSPTPIVLAEALRYRENAPASEALQIAYMAGFTHYLEARESLSAFGLEVTRNAPVLLLDRRRDHRHAKILISDMTHALTKLTNLSLSERLRVPPFPNMIATRDSDGSDIPDLNEITKGLSDEAFKAFANSVTLGLFENVLSYTPDAHAGLGTTFHVAYVPMRNMVENLQRLFCNVTAVVYANDIDDGFNLSVKRIGDDLAIYPMLASALWYIIDQGPVEQVVELLREAGARYKLVAYMGEDADYLGAVIPDLEREIRKSEEDAATGASFEQHPIPLGGQDIPPSKIGMVPVEWTLPKRSAPSEKSLESRGRRRVFEDFLLATQFNCGRCLQGMLKGRMRPPKDHVHGPRLPEEMESRIGPICRGWGSLPDGRPAGFQIVEFGGTAWPATPYSTLGLANHPLGTGSGTILQELMVFDRPQSAPFQMPILLQRLGREALSRNGPYMQGQVIGDESGLLEGSTLEGLYVGSVPRFPSQFSGCALAAGDDVTLALLAPISHAEHEYIRQQGWETFEARLAALNLDLLDPVRPSIV